MWQRREASAHSFIMRVDALEIVSLDGRDKLSVDEVAVQKSLHWFLVILDSPVPRRGCHVIDVIRTQFDQINIFYIIL